MYKLDVRPQELAIVLVLLLVFYFWCDTICTMQRYKTYLKTTNLLLRFFNFRKLKVVKEVK